MIKKGLFALRISHYHPRMGSVPLTSRIAIYHNTCLTMQTYKKQWLIMLNEAKKKQEIGRFVSIPKENRCFCILALIPLNVM